jgi:hypothetical protein
VVLSEIVEKHHRIRTVSSSGAWLLRLADLGDAHSRFLADVYRSGSRYVAYPARSSRL